LKLINLAQIQGGVQLHTDVETLKTSLASLESDSTDAIAAALAEAKEYADEQELTTVVDEADASVDVTSATSGKVTTYSVAAKISAGTGNALSLANDGLMVTVPTAAEYSISKLATPESDYLASYQLTKDGTAVGTTINIPKDYLVKSATVGTIAVADTPVQGAVGDKYLDFVVNTVGGDETDAHIYLNVKDLTDVYTGSTGAEIIVGVDAQNQITASLVTGGIALSKLATEVIDTIDAAKQAGLDAAADLATYQTSNDAAVGAVADRVTALETSVGNSGTVGTRLTTVEGKAAANETAIATLNGDASTTGSVAKTVKDAVDTAVGNITITTDALDGRLDDVEAAVTTLNGDVNTNGSVAKAANDAEVAAKAYTDVLAANLKAEYEVFQLTTTAQTVFTLAKTPNAEKITVYINGLAYLETEGDITVNRANKTVTWAATAANNGFDLTTTVADEVVIKYYTYTIPA